MVRIGYTTNDEGNLVSNLFPLQSDMAFIIIFVKERRYQIRGISDDGNVRTMSESSGSTVDKCKSLARKKIISLGFKFKDGIRNKI